MYLLYTSKIFFAFNVYPIFRVESIRLKFFINTHKEIINLTQPDKTPNFVVVGVVRSLKILVVSTKVRSVI